MVKEKFRIGFIFFLFASVNLWAQGEPFSKRTVISGMDSPWEITYGPNDSLWVTENVNYLVKRVNIANGNATTLLNLSGLKNFSSGDGGRWPQGGLMGMALHPNLYSTDAAVRGAKPWVYLAYVYDRPTGQNCSTNANSSDACLFHTRIVRYDYSGNTLSNPVIILDNISGSNDHNSGRLKIGPDLKLYYTIGDMGAGQFNNAARTNNAQAMDILEGKIIRLNSETDGDAGLDAWIPDDNPFYNSSSITGRDYVFSMGHRNAQGIIWANVNGTNHLYNCEHGDKSDDEVNEIVAGRNFGWNRVSGYCDGNYDGKTLGGYSPVNESGFCSVTPAYSNPITTFFTATASEINSFTADYLTWPTIAPSGIDFYAQNKIPGWQNSLLITCLKAGRVYRIRLNATGDGLLPFSNGTDTTSYFRGLGRFRDLAISPDGLKIYLA
ncbi:MAG TPA: PQQ-dependent sugar dehydrogenase, partial [Flavisolibacter sp.]|nr:PQQ-dependent sugar dehydrogenase [Flavisolibacter sp.]